MPSGMGSSAVKEEDACRLLFAAAVVIAATGATTLFAAAAAAATTTSTSKLLHELAHDTLFVRGFLLLGFLVDEFKILVPLAASRGLFGDGGCFRQSRRRIRIRRRFRLDRLDVRLRKLRRLILVVVRDTHGPLLLLCQRNQGFFVRIRLDAPLGLKGQHLSNVARRRWCGSSAGQIDNAQYFGDDGIFGWVVVVVCVVGSCGGHGSMVRILATALLAPTGLSRGLVIRFNAGGSQHGRGWILAAQGSYMCISRFRRTEFRDLRIDTGHSFACCSARRFIVPRGRRNFNGIDTGTFRYC